MRYSGLLCSALPRGGSAEARRDDERLGTGRGEKGIPVRRSSLTLPNVTEGTEEAHYRKLDIHASRPTQRSPPLPPIQVEGAICRLSSPSFFLSGQASPGRNETETEKQGPSRARGLEWRVAWGVTSLTPPSASDLSATHRRLLRTCVASFRLASLSTVFVNHSFRPPYSLPPLTLLSAKADLLAGSHGTSLCDLRCAVVAVSNGNWFDCHASSLPIFLAIQRNADIIPSHTSLCYGDTSHVRCVA